MNTQEQKGPGGAAPENEPAGGGMEASVNAQEQKGPGRAAPENEPAGGGKKAAPAGLTIRPLEEHDLAGAAAIEATAPDAWSEDALRSSLQAQREGGAARLFAAQWRGGAEADDTGTVPAAGSVSERQRDCPLCRMGSKTKEPSPCLAGIAAFQLAAGEASLDTLTVVPAFRRQGVARALLQTALQSLCAEGATACFLEVRESNAPAIALYQSLGFAAVGCRRGFYQNPAEDALVMRCELPGARE